MFLSIIWCFLPIIILVIIMKETIEKIKNDFQNVPDLKFKEIKITSFKTIWVVYMETVCDSTKVNDFILKNLTKYNKNMDLNSNIPGPNTSKIQKYDEIEFYLTNGFAIVISDKNIIAIEVKADLSKIGRAHV